MLYEFLKKKLKFFFEVFDVEGSFIFFLMIVIYIKWINKWFLICYFLINIVYKMYIVFFILYLMYNEFIKNFYYINKIIFYNNKLNKVKNIVWEMGKDR